MLATANPAVLSYLCKDSSQKVNSPAPTEPVLRSPEPEFLKILKCDLAESASTGFQFNC
jgi:hypothetical protein